MKTNVGRNDRLLRVLVASIALILYFSGLLPAWLGVTGLVVAVILVLTSLVSFCPLYALLGINSCPVKERA